VDDIARTPIGFNAAVSSAVSLPKRALRRVMRIGRGVAARHRPLWLDRIGLERGLQQQEARIGALPGEGAPSIGVETVAGIPTLAWLGIREGRSYRFLLGDGVERLPDGVFEGGWVGDFGDIDSLPGAEHFGSGVLFDRAEPLFMPPKNPREFLFVLRDKRAGRDLISSSLCFCFRAARIGPDDPIFRLTSEHLVRTTHAATRIGVHRYDPLVAESERFVLLRLMVNNFRIDAEGRLRFEQSFPGRRFADFSAYRRHLSETVARGFENIRDPRRARTLPPIASVSSGYDSTAVAALATEHGCDEALTIDVQVYGGSDSGARVAEALGMKLHRFQHAMGPTIGSLETALEGALLDRSKEFIATAGMGDDVTFSAFEPVLRGRTLLTGVYGDGLWDRGYAMPSHLPIGIRFGKSMTEFRLRVGFAHFGPIYSGAYSPSSILRINMSSEMRPFSIGGSYDRPIGRRIVEEAGVPRDAFGQAKRATSPDPLDHSAHWDSAVVEIAERYAPADALVG